MRKSKSIASAQIFAFSLLFFTTLLFGKTNTDPKEHEVFAQSPGFFFVENKGQWEEDIKYKLTMGPNRLYMKTNSLFYQLLDPADLAERSHRHEHCNEYDHHEDVVIHGHNFMVDFIGASPNVKTTSDKKLTAYHNYILGNDPSKWTDHVGLFAEASYENIYDGIDLKFYFSENNLKYDYIVEPGANPSDIVMEYNHADKVFLKKGKLHVVTSVNEMIEQEPFAYQIIDDEKVQVTCRFKLSGNQMSFDFPNGYNQLLPLIIDPVLVFASYSGSTGDNWGMTATYDEDGNLYGGGLAFNDGNYPVTPGAFDTDHPGFVSVDPGDMGISKFSANGQNLIYSTYIGGRGLDVPHSMIVNSQDELVILGTTSSSNYPVSSDAFDRTFNGGGLVRLNSGLLYNSGTDIVVTVLNKAGSALVGSTYVGGSGNDGLHTRAVGAPLNYSDELRGEIIIDDSDNIYVASTSRSNNFPTSTNAFDRFNNGEEDAVVFKLTPTANNLIWATYIGGDATEAAFSLKLDSDNNPYVVGMTSGSDFPVSPRGLNQTFQRVGSEGFVVHLGRNGDRILNATYLNRSDFAYFVELDSDGQVYVVGQSSSGNYPVTGGVYSNPRSTMFLHKLNPELSQTGFSTLLGNSNGTRGIFVPSAFLVDVCKRIYISGWGGETNESNITGMPVTSDAFQGNTDGSDFYLMVLKADATDLEYASYFGGDVSNEHVDGGTSRFDKRGIIYQAVCAGCGGSSDFPTTPGAHSNQNRSGNCNLGVFKFDFQFGEIVADADAAPELSGCAPFRVDFQNRTTGATLYNWDFGDGGTSGQRAPVHTFTEVGTFQVRLIGSIEENCIAPDTTFLTIETIKPPEGVTDSQIICEGDLTQLTSTVTDPGFTYEWSNGATTNSLEVSTGGVYWVDAMEDNCPQRDSFIIEGIPNGNTTSTIGLCEGLERTISSSNDRPNATFEWDDGTRSQSIEIDQLGTYFVMAIEMGCMSIDSFIVIQDSINVDALVLDIDCVGRDKGIIDGSTIGGERPYEYALNSSAFSTNNVFDDLAAGAYSLKSRDVNGCQDEINLMIELPPSVEVDLGAIQQICLGDSIQLSATTNLQPNEIASIAWQGLDNLNCPDCLTQMVRPVVNSKYSLVIVSDDGCVDSTAVNVMVLPKRPVYIPSAFSPDNDGINDIFQIFARPGVVENIHTFQVYDRWGELLFVQNDFQPNDPAFGWDGIFRDQRLNSAVFAWYAKIEFIDGVTEIFEGDVTLLK